MADLHLFGGEKGGVGKSFVCRAAIEYLLQVHPTRFTVFETDRSNDDVKRIYSQVAPVKLAIFSESEKFEDAANAIYNRACEQRVVCNLPAQVFPALKQWWQVNHLAEIAPADAVRFYLWFVTDGGFDSLQLFEKSLGFFGDGVQHLFVKNHGRCDDWGAVDEDDGLQRLLADHHVPILNFPKCHGSKIRNKMDKESLTFGQAISTNPVVFDSISRSRVSHFLKGAFVEFERVGVFA
jgi:hypothetical protein